jgi:translation initiation factor IF-2
MRGPGLPGQPSPGGPGSFVRRGPAQGRQMHPTSPGAQRPELATVMPTPDQQRRHQAKPGGGRGPRTREEREEGVLRERAGKRPLVAEPPPIDREITVAEGVTVKELSEKLGVKANLVVKKLFDKKIFATINQTLDVKLAEEVAREFGASTNQVTYEEESTQDIDLAEDQKDMVRRAPVVTVMGHVDHGKTSLLDAIRDTRVALREAGGITQAIGAYTVEKNGKRIVFIDTPGHKAFTRMRSRGAKVTDIVVLVVAADDGVMPQTLEAIDHAKAAGTPIIVAINKIDKPDAQIDRIKQQLSDRGLLAEDWGGDVVMVPVSAKSGQNLGLLLEMILLVAEMLDLKANPGRPALATVLEAQLDKGRGPVATLLVRNGTLRTGDQFIVGSSFSKVRAMYDDRGNQIREAEPAMPVEVIGFEELPGVGDTFQVVTDTVKAKQVVSHRGNKERELQMAKGARTATLTSLNQQFKEGDLKDLNVIIKADVGGMAEVVSESLQQLTTDKVRVRVLRSGVGAISEDDVLLASASEALIVGFNVKTERNAVAVAEQQKVDIRTHSIIYELIDEVKLAMTGLLDPVYKETVLGHADVKQTFKISKIGTVAGCYVTDGVIKRDSQIRVTRGGELIHTGKIEALKRFKNDASEVKNGVECGISLANFNNIEEGDVLEAFTMERVLPSLQTT